MIEREHRVELLRLYDKNLEEKECYEGDVGSGLVELIMEAKMMREENIFFTYQGSFSFKDDRNEIQRILLEEMSFTNSDNSQDLSGERCGLYPHSHPRIIIIMYLENVYSLNVYIHKQNFTLIFNLIFLVFVICYINTTPLDMALCFFPIIIVV